MSVQEYAREIIAKYEKYISNIRYHLENNNPTVGEQVRLRQRIADFKTFIDDLAILK